MPVGAADSLPRASAVDEAAEALQGLGLNREEAAGPGGAGGGDVQGGQGGGRQGGTKAERRRT